MRVALPPHLLLLLFLWRTVDSGVCPANLDISSCGEGDCVPLSNTQAACLCPSGMLPIGDTDAVCIEPEVICNTVYTVDKLCFNGGTCSPVDGARGAYSCSCPSGYAGDNCQRSSNACDVTANACVNGGTCIPLSNDAFSCMCPSEYEGTYCENKRQIGAGGAGVALKPFWLILLWALWMVLLVTFLYCSVRAILGWWADRVKGFLTAPVAAVAGAAT